MTLHLEMGLGLGHSLTELPTAFSIHPSPRLELSNKKHLNNQVDIFYMDLSERLNY